MELNEKDVGIIVNKTTNEIFWLCQNKMLTNDDVAGHVAEYLMATPAELVTPPKVIALPLIPINITPEDFKDKKKYEEVKRALQYNEQIARLIWNENVSAKEDMLLMQKHESRMNRNLSILHHLGSDTDYMKQFMDERQSSDDEEEIVNFKLMSEDDEKEFVIAIQHGPFKKMEWKKPRQVSGSDLHAVLKFRDEIRNIHGDDGAKAFDELLCSKPKNSPCELSEILMERSMYIF